MSSGKRRIWRTKRQWRICAEAAIQLAPGSPPQGWLKRGRFHTLIIGVVFAIDSTALMPPRGAILLYACVQSAPSDLPGRAWQLQN